MMEHFTEYTDQKLQVYNYHSITSIQVSSAFIPFCAFGGKFLGQRIDNFNIPVCNSFKPRLLNDNLCYEIDLNNITNKETIKEDIKTGFVFIMDYNEDRQVINRDNFKTKEQDGFVQVIKDLEDANNHATIHLNTIGNVKYFK